MAIEIERKYLVKNDLWKSQVLSEMTLKQGYLANSSNATVRVRVAGDRAFLTIKSATEGLRRSEFEYPIPVADAEDMLEGVAIRPVIDKVRYKVKVGGHVWDLDVFAGDNKGLVLAEVELDSEDEAFELPAWAGAEVSGDPRYYNVNLVRRPYGSW
jgi:adenylate cyclase